MPTDDTKQVPADDTNQIPAGRQFVAYFGLALVGIGLLVFISVFVTASTDNGMSDPSPFGNPRIVTFEGSQVDFQGGAVNGTNLVVEGGPFGRDVFERSRERSNGMGTRAIVGMLLMMVGMFLRYVGRAGLSGSGVILDPAQAARDLAPYSRQAGAMLKDALDEAGVRLGGAPGRVVMIKCQECAALNEDGSKFCQECGKPI